jgi:hypothetical protein
MADNTTLNAGSGGDVIATDDIGGVKYQRMKLVYGNDGQNHGDVSHANPFPIDIVGAHTEFGALAIAQRTNQIEAAFAASGTLSTLLTLANTGSGASDWGTTTPGMATFSTGATNPSTAKGTSLTSILYRSGEEVYAMFTAAFTAGVAGTFQRVGLTDEAEGFFMGYEGTSFCVSYITNSVVTSVAQASWNIDTATGQVGSDFTSSGVVQTLDPTKLNLYRIRFGWLGIGPADFEVMAPDGAWVSLHQFKFPNSQATPSIRTPNLPMKFWLSSTGSNLVVKSSCIGAGTANQMVQKASQPLYAMPIQQMHNSGRTHVNYFAVAAAAGATTIETAITLTKSSGTAATTTGTSFVIPAGKRFRITALSVATRGNATATIQTTTFNLRINTGGAVTTTSTPILLSARSATPATASAWDRVMIPIPDGFEIAGDGVLQFGITAAATFTTNAPTWDVTIIGFEY